MKRAILLLVAGASLYAGTVYNTSASLTGNRFVGVGGGLIDGGGTGYDNLFLAWNIVPLSSVYIYTYTISGFTAPNLSHVLLDLSDDCVVPTSAGTPLPTCITGATVNNAAAVITLGDWCSGCQGTSNLGLPNDIVGAKFGGLPGGSITITFDSPRAPVWGDFYLKGGQQIVYNVGNLNHADPSTLDFIARPDGWLGDASTTPEPATLALTGAALIGLGLFRRRRR